MRLDESSLAGYLVRNLEHLTEADPVILTEYVTALLKKDKPTKELQKLCTENLIEFLGHATNSFVEKLFQALEDGSITASPRNSGDANQIEPSSAATSVEPIVQNSSSPKSEKVSSSGHLSDQEEKEPSDDDDDDRNHKHRRRENRSLSFDKDAQEPHSRRPIRKRDRPYENGRMFLERDPQSSEIQKEYNPSPLERTKFEKQRPGLMQLPQPPQGLGHRSRGFQAFGGPRFDLSHLPVGRGRARSTAPWNHHDLRFGSVDRLDFTSQMAPQGPTPSPFNPGTQSVPWGPCGLMHGIPNSGLDTLHPLGLQGILQTPFNPSFNSGMPRPRCRDFEERGFCLRGDMCPMEHGVHRIVVEDVQSLSQFNLPVSVPNERLLGMQDATGPRPVNAPSSMLTNSKALQSKGVKSVVADFGLGLNEVLPGSAAGDTDLYDPDQPLWSKDQPGTSRTLLKLSSLKTDDPDPIGDEDSNDNRNDSVLMAKTTKVSQNTLSSVRRGGRNSVNRLERASSLGSGGCLGNEKKEGQGSSVNVVHGFTSQRKQNLTEDVVPKAMNATSTLKVPLKDTSNNGGRGLSKKALRTLFVNGVPLKNNKREALLSHFQKFGEVIDIYIPHNGEKAFVQFARREEAEAALKAPDAVMGNRFIKLWWANRDNIPGEDAASVAPQGPDCSSLSSKPSSDIVKENFPSEAPKVGNPIPNFNISLSVSVPQKNVMPNGPKPFPPVQKKLENLEHLREELRKKQEMLDQKRNDFRRQLDKLEKQGVTIKDEVSSEQAVKRQKVDTSTTTVKAVTMPGLRNPIVTLGARPNAEKILDKSCSRDTMVSPSSSKENSLMPPPPQSQAVLKQPTRFSGSPFLVNRFKLDNRPTAFRVLPPLPPDFVNIAVLKEHFSPFGDLSLVKLEDPEIAHTGSSVSKPSQSCSAHITFTTRRSAERAFLVAKCWQGHNLQFSWITPSSNENTVDGGSESFLGAVTNYPHEPIDAETRTSGVSSSTTRQSSSTVVSVTAATNSGGREPEKDDGTDGGSMC